MNRIKSGHVDFKNVGAYPGNPVYLYRDIDFPYN